MSHNRVPRYCAIAYVTVVILLLGYGVASSTLKMDETTTWVAEADDILAAAEPLDGDFGEPDFEWDAPTADVPARKAVLEAPELGGEVEIAWQEGIAPSRISIERKDNAFRLRETIAIDYETDPEALERVCLTVSSRSALDDGRNEVSACAAQFYGSDEKGRRKAVRALREALWTPPGVDGILDGFTMAGRAEDPAGELWWVGTDPASHLRFWEHQGTSPCDPLLDYGVGFDGGTRHYEREAPVHPYYIDECRDAFTVQGDDSRGAAITEFDGEGGPEWFSTLKYYNYAGPDRETVQWEDTLTIAAVECRAPKDFACTEH
ncbi:hypothetical protein [Salininema proteolyticum]|uniref:C-type lectin domain-containing protein n=1 Tax=Salininema proteolyticum TaxID=1607685 RepID=A0ABV8U3K7_9ACTN